MLERITADQFEVCPRSWVSGRQTLEEFGFDEQKCVIEVLEEGSLSITQEGKNSSYFAGPAQWRRAPGK